MSRSAILAVLESLEACSLDDAQDRERVADAIAGMLGEVTAERDTARVNWAHWKRKAEQLARKP